MSPIATVIMPVHNEARFLLAAIASLARQTMPDFELIVVDDGSTDRTKEVMENCCDQRVIYVRNGRNMGVAASRNRAIEMARADYLFFTDGDCIVTPNWLEEGLRLFQECGYAGIEGELVYVADDYKPFYSDRVVENRTGGQYMTANMAYRKDILERIGMFNTSLRRYSDREAALRVKRIGKIGFERSMVVYHTHAKWTVSSFVKYARAAQYTVILFKSDPDHQREHGIFGRVYAPEKLLSLFFPPLVLRQARGYRFRSGLDFLLLSLTPLTNLYERLSLWKAAIEERVFLI